jgi:hypothetical protein
MFKINVSIQPSCPLAIRMPACNADRGGVEIEENSSDRPVMCDEVGSASMVQWGLYNESSHYNKISLCTNTGSCSVLTNYITSRAPSSTSSTFIFTPAARLHGKWDFECKESTSAGAVVSPVVCPVNIVGKWQVFVFSMFNSVIKERYWHWCVICSHI